MLDTTLLVSRRVLYRFLYLFCFLLFCFFYSQVCPFIRFVLEKLGSISCNTRLYFVVHLAQKEILTEAGTRGCRKVIKSRLSFHSRSMDKWVN